MYKTSFSGYLYMTSLTAVLNRLRLLIVLIASLGWYSRGFIPFGLLGALKSFAFHVRSVSVKNARQEGTPPNIHVRSKA